jgi:hypothetical protein
MSAGRAPAGPFDNKAPFTVTVRGVSFCGGFPQAAGGVAAARKGDAF